MRYKRKKSRLYDPREPIYSDLRSLFPIIIEATYTGDGMRELEKITLANGDTLEIHLEFIQ